MTRGIVIVAFILFILVILTGCGASDDDDRCLTQYTTTSLNVGGTGLMLEPASNMYVSFEQIEQFYLDTEACVGVHATGPTVRFESYMGPMGLWGPGLVRINTNTYWYRDCKTDEQILKHEFVHELLHLGGYPLEEQGAHSSPLFVQCVPIVGVDNGHG